MSLIKKLMGRRQFLIAGGALSASALAFKKLAGLVGQGSQTGSAIAAERIETPGEKAKTDKYPHLLSPLKVRNKVFKNRIYQTVSTPHCLQGPEIYPADPVRAFYSERAKNAAIVHIHSRFGDREQASAMPGMEGMLHFAGWKDTPRVRNYFAQLIEDIHCEGCLVGGATVDGGMGGPGARSGETEPVSMEDLITQAKQFEDQGYDAVYVGTRGQKNREELRPYIEQMRAVRKATNLIIVAWLLPVTPGKSRGQQGFITSGPEIEELVAMAKMLEGSADMIQMKDAGHHTNHPNSFTMEKDEPWMLKFSQAIKESGAKIVSVPTGGFHYPDLNEQFIARGKADMIGMATPLIADPEYVKKLYEDRAEDIAPCVMCHDCHGINMTVGPWFDICTVNPEFGLSETKKNSIRPPALKKKVAVIGGGPAGMKAAITAAERGHDVTLYEKSDALGGLQKHTDYTRWKWAYKDFKDYLIRQVNKRGIHVRLKTEATPDMIKAEGYDTVLAAIGAAPADSGIPGADGKNVYDIVSVYRNKNSLGKKIIFIGAGVYGTETGISLAKDGFKVTAITSAKQMIPEEFIGPHNKANQIDIYQNHENFSYVLEATPTRISDGVVTYKDPAGNEKSIRGDSVVIYTGLRPKVDEGLEFSDSAGQFFLLGECLGAAGLQKSLRSAYFTASRV